METIKTTIKSEAVISEDNKHRVLLYREWERNHPTAMVIMIHPSTSTVVQSDLTTVCVLNNLERLDYGSVYLMNLYSQVTDKLNYRFSSDEEILNGENDQYILKVAEKASIIILAWGQAGETNRRVRQRQLDLLEKLQIHEHKLKTICDKRGRSYLHPLTPQIRNEWILKPVSIEKWQTKYVKPEHDATVSPESKSKSDKITS